MSEGMNKGIGLHELKNIILVVLVVFIAFILLVKFVGPEGLGFKSIQELLMQLRGQRYDSTSSKLTDAIECAYYRCVGGDGKVGCDYVEGRTWKGVYDPDQPESKNLYRCKNPTEDTYWWDPNPACTRHPGGERAPPGQWEDVDTACYEACKNPHDVDESAGYEDGVPVDVNGDGNYGDDNDKYDYCKCLERLPVCPCEGGWVCDGDAKEYPVEAHVGGGVAKDFWKTLIKDTVGTIIAVPPKAIKLCKAECGESSECMLLKGDYLVFPLSANCEGDEAKGFDSCEIDEGDYYLWTERVPSFELTVRNFVIEYICDRRPS